MRMVERSGLKIIPVEAQHLVLSCQCLSEMKMGPLENLNIQTVDLPFIRIIFALLQPTIGNQRSTTPKRSPHPCSELQHLPVQAVDRR